MKLLLMCASQVGDGIAEWLLENHTEDVGAVVTISESAVSSAARAMNIPSVVFASEQQLRSELAKLAPFDLGILAWWPKLISPAVMALANGGFINTHPSLLPHNRGQHDVD